MRGKKDPKDAREGGLREAMTKARIENRKKPK